MNKTTPQLPDVLPVEGAALFVGLDGIVTPNADKPGAQKASPACRIVLKRARDHLRGRLAVLSGRTLDSIDAVLGGAVNCVAGLYGRQRRTPLGQVCLTAKNPRVADALSVLRALAQARPGLVVTAAESSVAIDYRSAAAAEDAVLEAVDHLAKMTGLVIRRGDHVAELQTPAPDKGSALARFMYEVPFRGAAPIVLGVGRPDEAAFVEASKRGGIGILVGPPRRTNATGRLDTPVAALSWIMRSLDKGAFDLRETRNGCSAPLGISAPAVSQC